MFKTIKSKQTVNLINDYYIDGQNTQQNSLNDPVKDCLVPSYTNRFKTKRLFITKNANVAKFDSFIYCNP